MRYHSEYWFGRFGLLDFSLWCILLEFQYIMARKTIQDHLCFHFLAAQHTAWGILVPRLGFKPSPSAVEVLSLNHCTTREVPFPSSFQVLPRQTALVHHRHTDVNFPEEPFVISEAASVVVTSLCLQVLCRSKNRILNECFLVAELENRRRAPTVSVCVAGGGGCLCKIGKAAETTQFAPKCNHFT